MQLNHIGVINRNKDEAVRFYRDFLGLNIVKDVVVEKDLSSQLFSVLRDLNMVVFEHNGIKIEVFIIQDHKISHPNVRHSGILVDDLQQIKNKAHQNGIEIIIGKTKDKTVHFLKDFSGNLIEVKQK